MLSSSLQQTLTHVSVTSAAESAHHGSACIATTEHMQTPTLTVIEIRRTDGSLHTYIGSAVLTCTFICCSIGSAVLTCTFICCSFWSTVLTCTFICSSAGSTVLICSFICWECHAHIHTFICCTVESTVLTCTFICCPIGIAVITCTFICCPIVIAGLTCTLICCSIGNDMLTCTFVCCSIGNAVLTCTFICCSLSILSADEETRLTEPSRILERWADHFSDVLNRPSTISQAAIDTIAQRPFMDELAYRPTLDETTAAIKKVSSGNATGPDAIAAEIYKYGGINLTKSPVKLSNDIWDIRAVPQECKDATIVHIYKRKGEKSICDNHRGIYLLCIAGKILTRIPRDQLSLHLADNVLPESQCGFRAQRSTLDMIFADRQVQETCRES